MANLKAFGVARRLAELRLIKFGATPEHLAEVDAAIASEEAAANSGLSSEQMEALAQADGIASRTVAQETVCGCASCTDRRWRDSN